MEIKEYIESGALESYLLGSATATEIDELLSLKAKYPQVKDALEDLEQGLEHIAASMAITPPPGTWMKIERELKELTRQPEFRELEIAEPPIKDRTTQKENDNEFVEVHGPSSHIRVNKVWRWILAAIFVLGKIFLGFAIYYYLESKQAHEQIQELKMELQQIKRG